MIINKICIDIIVTVRVILNIILLILLLVKSIFIVERFLQ